MASSNTDKPGQRGLFAARCSQSVLCSLSCLKDSSFICNMTEIISVKAYEGFCRLKKKIFQVGKKNYTQITNSHRKNLSY